MTPTQLKELQASLRDRAKPLGDRRWIDENQRLAGDLANVIGHICDMEDDAEHGFHDAQDAANSHVPLITTAAPRKEYCIDCKIHITGTMVGAGDGTGSKYRCRECALRDDAVNSKAKVIQLREAITELKQVYNEMIAARDAEIERLREEVKDQAHTIESTITRLKHVNEEGQAPVHTTPTELCGADIFGLPDDRCGLHVNHRGPCIRRTCVQRSSNDAS